MALPLRIQPLTATTAPAFLPDLIELLRDGVNQGASIGFHPPLTTEIAQDYWFNLFTELDAGPRSRQRPPMAVLLVAEHQGQVVGSVQLQLATKPNAVHRAEVQKLMVHTQVRRQGIARALMQGIEAEARARGRQLLVLDTRQGDGAEGLYQSLGYQMAGVIPHYVLEVDGRLQATVLYYRWIGSIDPEALATGT